MSYLSLDDERPRGEKKPSPSASFDIPAHIEIEVRDELLIRLAEVNRQTVELLTQYVLVVAVANADHMDSLEQSVRRSIAHLLAWSDAELEKYALELERESQKQNPQALICQASQRIVGLQIPHGPSE